MRELWLTRKKRDLKKILGENYLRVIREVTGR
jgi:microsomal dipeptidase-like Zn-dependent dipeptidase